MAYLPKHYIRTGQFAEPGNFITKTTGESYSGPYYQVATGQYFTGTNPQDSTTQELIPIGVLETTPGTAPGQVSVAFNLDVPTYLDPKSLNDLQESGGFNYQVYQPTVVDAYTKVKNYTSQYYDSRILPYAVTPLPEEKDYRVGEYQRYFCKKTNEILYLELDQVQYNGIVQKNPKYFWEQYFAFTLPWTLTGNADEVYKTNQAIVLRKIKTLQLPMFDNYLRQDYLRYYRRS